MKEDLVFTAAADLIAAMAVGTRAIIAIINEDY